MPITILRGIEMGISLPKFVRCPDCNELSHIDELLTYDLEVEYSEINPERISYFEATCGCDFCGFVWSEISIDPSFPSHYHRFD